MYGRHTYGNTTTPQAALKKRNVYSMRINMDCELSALDSAISVPDRSGMPMALPSWCVHNVGSPSLELLAHFKWPTHATHPASHAVCFLTLSHSFSRRSSETLDDVLQLLIQWITIRTLCQTLSSASSTHVSACIWNCLNILVRRN